MPGGSQFSPLSMRPLPQRGTSAEQLLLQVNPGGVVTDSDFQHTITVNGSPVIVNDRAVVLTFNHLNWAAPQTVYVYAPDDPRAEGDRVVVVQHTVISDTSAVALAVTTVCFGCGHLYGYPPGPLGAVLAGAYGLALGVLRWWCGGLALAVGCHMCADATIFGLLFWS